MNLLKDTSTNTRYCLSILIATAFTFFVIHKDLLPQPLTWTTSTKKIHLSHKFSINGRQNAAACTTHDCLDVRRCVRDPKLMEIYVQDLFDVVDPDSGLVLNPQPSADFLELREWILKSPNSVGSAEEACVIVPGIDTLSTKRFGSRTDITQVLDAVISQFGTKPNLLVFNLDGETTLFGDAIVAAPTFDTVTHRPLYDIVIPSWKMYDLDLSTRGYDDKELGRVAYVTPFGVVDQELDLAPKLKAVDESVIVVGPCKKGENCPNGDYTRTLKSSTFILLSSQTHAYHIILRDILQSNAIPVFLGDDFLLPLRDVIDWSTCSLTLSPNDLSYAILTLKSLSTTRISEIRAAVYRIYDTYFREPNLGISAAIQVAESRLVPLARLPKDTVDEGYIHTCQNYVTVILHHDTTQKVKLQWLLRTFIFTPTNSSAIVIVTHNPRAIDGALADVVLPTTSVPIFIVDSPVNIQNGIVPFDLISTYTTLCPALVVSSCFPADILDDQTLASGFSVSAEFVQKEVSLISGRKQVDDSDGTCPPGSPTFYPASRMTGMGTTVTKAVDRSCFDGMNVATGRKGEEGWKWVVCG